MESIATSRFPLQGTDLRVWLLGAILLPLALFLLLHGQYNLLLMILTLSTLILAWRINRTASISLAFIFLFLLGDIRRILGLLGGTPSLDPLLLVGALFAFYLATPLLLRLKLTDSLSKAVLALMALMVLEIANPRQGPLIVGVSGALFTVAPMLWFWIGRRCATEELMSVLLYRVVVPVGLCAAALGIYQTYVGFLPWEEAWIKAVSSTYLALNLGGGHIRSFGFSVNSVEYGTLLTLATVIVVAAALTGRKVFALLFPVLVTAMVLASMRGALVKGLIAILVMWVLAGANSKSWRRRVLIGAVVGAAALALSSHGDGGGTGATELSQKASAAQFATSHVTNGLTHPFDSRYSTAGLHWQLVVNGVENGFRYPAGSGLGATSLGAGKFGGDTAAAGSSEVDISDAFITLGFVGGFLFVYVILSTLRRAFQYLRRGTRRDLAVPLLGMLIASLGAWIGLGQYAITPLLWLCIGFLAGRGELPRNSMRTGLSRDPLENFRA